MLNYTKENGKIETIEKLEKVESNYGIQKNVMLWKLVSGKPCLWNDLRYFNKVLIKK